jgi:host factor-I protein
MTAKQGMNLQDSFLNQVRRENAEVRILLANGKMLKGHVKGFDNFTVIVHSRGGEQSLIYKHAIAQIISHRAGQHRTDHELQHDHSDNSSAPTAAASPVASETDQEASLKPPASPTQEPPRSAAPAPSSEKPNRPPARPQSAPRPQAAPPQSSVPRESAAPKPATSEPRQDRPAEAKPHSKPQPKGPAFNHLDLSQITLPKGNDAKP